MKCRALKKATLTATPTNLSLPFTSSVTLRKTTRARRALHRALPSARRRTAVIRKLCIVRCRPPEGGEQPSSASCASCVAFHPKEENSRHPQALHRALPSTRRRRTAVIRKLCIVRCHPPEGEQPSSASSASCAAVHPKEENSRHPQALHRALPSTRRRRTAVIRKLCIVRCRPPEGGEQPASASCASCAAVHPKEENSRHPQAVHHALPSTRRRRTAVIRKLCIVRCRPPEGEQPSSASSASCAAVHPKEENSRHPQALHRALPSTRRRRTAVIRKLCIVRCRPPEGEQPSSASCASCRPPEGGEQPSSASCASCAAVHPKENSRHPQALHRALPSTRRRTAVIRKLCIVPSTRRRRTAVIRKLCIVPSTRRRRTAVIRKLCVVRCRPPEGGEQPSSASSASCAAVHPKEENSRHPQTVRLYAVSLAKEQSGRIPEHKGAISTESIEAAKSFYQ